MVKKVKTILDVTRNNGAGDGRIELPTAVLETAVMPLN